MNTTEWNDKDFIPDQRKKQFIKNLLLLHSSWENISCKKPSCHLGILTVLIYLCFLKAAEKKKYVNTIRANGKKKK